MKATAFFLLLLPAAAHAEVMDKEFSAAIVWAWAIAPAAIAFFAGRYRAWLLLLAVPPPVAFYVAQLLEVTDRSVGPAIAHEAGPLYVFASWAGPFALVLGVLLGLAVRRRPGPPNTSSKRTRVPRAA